LTSSSCKKNAASHSYRLEVSQVTSQNGSSTTACDVIVTAILLLDV
jgi:hypothetical protein